MSISIQEAAAIIRENDNFLILCHAHPDGDTLGSAAALCRSLHALGKRARVHCNDEIPQKFLYLFEGLKEQDFKEKFIISADVAAVSLLGEETAQKYGERVGLSVDHHGSNRLFAEKTFVNPSAAANCENIYLLIKELGAPIDKATADCIYTGVATDTGCFRYTNVTSKTHRIAAEMIDFGADAGAINRVMFETKSREYAMLERLALDSLELCLGGKAAVITVTREMMNESGAQDGDFDGIPALARQIEGVLVGATLREKKNGKFKISLRTHEPVDAAEICKTMGGGGHPRAAGCEMEGTPAEIKVKLLEEVKKAL